MMESAPHSDEVMPGGRTLSRRTVLGAGLGIVGQALLGADTGRRPADAAAPGDEAGV